MSAPALAALATAFLFSVAVVRLAWVSDDAFITIRSVDHLVRGKGFVLNVGERVQSFTSPLWALLCVPFFALTRAPYASLIIPGLSCSLALCASVIRVSRRYPWSASVVLLVLSASVSFLHFSTSGLENPLAHLLVALFVFERLKRGPTPTRASFALAAGLVLTRFDYVLLVAPTLALTVVNDRRRALRFGWPACAATGAWVLFSTFYYGCPLPNTAYAKLNLAIPLGQRAAQGVSYLVDSACRDPMLPMVIGLALAFGCLRGVSSTARSLAIGVAAYVLYVVYIGGDFMSGRFLTTCYVACALLVVDVAFAAGGPALVAGSAVMGLFAISNFSDKGADPRGLDCPVPESGIVDERRCYVEYTGLAQNVRHPKWRDHSFMKQFEKEAAATSNSYIVFNVPGMASYANTTEKHIVEGYALTEPLLARIRYEPEPNWRIGHFLRPIPEGYLDSLRTGTNVIADPCLRHLYDLLSTITHGPLWSFERFPAIWELNTTRATCNAP